MRALLPKTIARDGAVRQLVCTAALAGLAFGGSANQGRADEGGVSFWVPGQQGSFAATPTTPGWSWATIYLHSSVSTDGASETPLGGEVQLGLQAQSDLVLFGPTYTFATPVLGGQASVSLVTWGALSQVDIDATLTGPGGDPISAGTSDSVTGFGDLSPQFTLKWSGGVHNYMAYVTGDIPAGRYDPNALANIGLGHGAIDVGGGYTYFDPNSGREASIVGGLTYNFTNPDTDYQSGVDLHVDWGTAQFVSDTTFVGLAGYYFQQLTPDSGDGAMLGDFKSRVAGIGPQAGYLFTLGNGVSGALTAKAYWEFAAENRPEGWNMWLGFTLSESPPG